MVPRERSDPGASSSSGLVHLTPGPGAVPLRSLAEEPTVAHVPESDDSGYMIMYCLGRAVIVDDRSAWPRTGQARIDSSPQEGHYMCQHAFGGPAVSLGHREIA